jgi:hypothetical protein
MWHQRQISRERGGGNPVGGTMKFRTFVEILDDMKHANIHLRMKVSLRASGGSRKRSSLWNAYFPHNIAFYRFKVTSASVKGFKITNKPSTANIIRKNLALSQGLYEPMQSLLVNSKYQQN